MCAMVILSCSKQQIRQGNEFEKLSSDTKDAIGLNSVKAVKQAYNMLSSEEKEELWELKLHSILNNSDLNESQRIAVKEIIQVLEVNGMKSLNVHPEIGEKFLSSKLNEYKKLFSPEELYMLVEMPFFSKNFSLDQSKTVLMKLNESVFALDATNCTCLYDIGCGIGNLCMTKNNSCTQQAECGLFGSSNCKGTCDNTTGPITP